MGNGHVSWCYTADGFVCILCKIFCILYQALVRHNIPTHFIFNRSAYAVHWSLAVMSFTVEPIYFHFVIYLRNQSKNISRSGLACTLSLQMCKITSGGKLCFSRTKSKSWLMHVKASICKWSLASDIIEIFSLIRSPFYGDNNKLWKLKRNRDQCKRTVFHLAECCYSFHYIQHAIKPRFHQVFL